jgi:RHS repeat-associated protein
MGQKQKLTLQLFTGIFLICVNSRVLAQTWNPSHRVGTGSGVIHFAYNVTPQQLVELEPAATPNTGLSYQWEQSTMPLSGFTNISGATSSSYTFSAPLAQTMYYRRKTVSGLRSIYSNVVKISLVSTGWEDLNYLRQHSVQTTGITTSTAVEQLTIGDKLQTTVYLDGLGRSREIVSRETATPATPSGTWGDIVSFSKYDAFGREAINYLSYTATTQPGKYKTTALTEQGAYYSAEYGESSPFSSLTYDNSPLNRVMNVKQPGTSWAAGSGKNAVYDLNTTTDNVVEYDVDYVQGNAPIYKGVFAQKTLYKKSVTDENGKWVVEFYNKSGQLVLKKIQLDNSPAGPYDGWICTYYIYDDFGQLRCEIQPEGVKYLSANSWSFAGGNGATILSEQCFQYFYDDKGRLIWKKTPGALAMNALYDKRDRIVFSQDGNQSQASTPQWTTSLYDNLDRPLISTLYNTTKTIATLQSDIDGAATSSTVTVTNAGTSSVTATLHLSPLSAANLNSSTTTTILGYAFYDNYSFGAVKTFNTTYTNTSAYNTSDPNVIPIAVSTRTSGRVTGMMTRVLGTTTFLASTSYYDDRGSLIQALADNLKAGTDIMTRQYHFTGRMLSTCNDHTTPSTGYTNYKTLTRYVFDKLGRVTSIQKQWGSNAMKTISGYEYDDMGRVKVKRLDPGYTGGGNADLETLNYSYNIHSQLTGVNKDYALKNPANYDKWSHFFGYYLGFDNRDNVFTAANLNGQVTGQLWNTMGDDAQRKYDYTYDNAGRLTTAVFNEKQHTGDSWSNTTMDFSVIGSSGNGGKITYDLNGNLLNMLHRGVLPGTATAITIDQLSYTYASYSNKLQSVTDAMTNTTVNGAFGDFKDGSNTSTPDYVYDGNGNVVIDLNKNAKDLAGVPGANGIKYNYLDKPEEIRVAGKGTIKITYSSGGRKLERRFISETQDLVKITTYINQFIYEESTTIAGATVSAFAISSINFEEGRIRVITPTTQNNGLDALTVDGNMDLPNSKRGAFDYFITDYQGNVRMIVTEEVYVASNTATLETNRATLEESIFGQAGGGNEVLVTRYATPSGWTGNTTSQVSRLGTNSGHNIGPNTLQKVMAGDKVTASVAYYHEGSPGGNNTSFVNTVLSSLAPALQGGATSTIVHGQASQIQSQLGGLTGFMNAVQPNGSNPSGSTPQAFLTILFFDERFNFVGASDGGVSQQQVSASVGSNGGLLGLPNVRAPKNGYAYVYISNQSNNHVYFDDFKVQVAQGNIAEENHYYAYGLKIATLSSKKLGDMYQGKLQNNYLYQGAASEMDEEIGWNDFPLRNYDAQTGRWVQQDPYQEFASPYIGMGGDPVNLIDPSGGSIVDGLTKAGTVAVFTVGGAIIGGVIGLLSGDDDFTGFLIGAGAGLAGGLGGFKLNTVTSAILRVVNGTLQAINNGIDTKQAGGAGNVQPGPSPDRNTSQGGREWDIAGYIKYWKDRHGRAMSDRQEYALGKGCIGVVMAEMDGMRGDPPLKNGYLNLQDALDAADAKQKEFDANPVKGKGAHDGDVERVMVYGFQFSDPEGNYDGKTTITKDEFDEIKKGGFNFGLWDPENKTFIDANHHNEDGYKGQMRIFERTRRQFDGSPKTTIYFVITTFEPKMLPEKEPEAEPKKE